MLDENGDVFIENNEIQMVYDTEFWRQVVKTQLAVHQGEWFFDVEKGANQHIFTGKNVTAEDIRDEIENVLLQIDGTFAITSFEADIDKSIRKATVKFSAETANGVKISINDFEV